MELQDIMNSLNALYRSTFDSFHGIMLYGSAARKEMHEESDIDIILLFNCPVDSTLKYAAYELVNDFMIEHDLFIDCKVYNLDDMRLQNTPFRKAVMSEGKLYAA